MNHRSLSFRLALWYTLPIGAAVTLIALRK
jgi:hypothetical protein